MKTKPGRPLIRSGSPVRLLSSILAIVVGLLVGLVILLVSNPSQAFAGFAIILMGGFNNGMSSIGSMLYFATPIILTGLSVGFAFKTGLFNIGTAGQFIVGAFCAVFVSVRFTFLPTAVHWPLAVLAGILGGALWAFLPGLLKAYFNVNEVIATIMMNYIGMYTVNLLVVKTIYNSLKNQSLSPVAVIPGWGLDRIFPGSSVNAGILIAIAAAVLIHILLNKTVFGYELKACGFNKDAALYAGINAKRGIVLSMVIAGALSGLGGALLYLSATGKSIEVVDVLAAEGFTGIPVALLGLSHPLGILLSGLFIAHLTLGGFYIQSFNFNPEIIGIITSVIIYFSAFALIVKTLFDRLSARRKTLQRFQEEEDREKARNAAVTPADDGKGSGA